MASTEYDFNSTRNEIIQRAFRICGALTYGESLTAEMQAQAVTALNHVVKSWQSEHIFLWSLVPTSITVSAATYAFSSDPAIIGIEQAYWRDSANNDQRVEIISFREYQDVPDKTDVGDPIQIAFVQYPTPSLYIYPTPNGNKTLYLTLIRKLKDMETANGNADFPVHFINALTYALAGDLADELGLPLSERNQIQSKAAALFQKAKRGDREIEDYTMVQSAFCRRR